MTLANDTLSQPPEDAMQNNVEYLKFFKNIIETLSDKKFQDNIIPEYYQWRLLPYPKPLTKTDEAAKAKLESLINKSKEFAGQLESGQFNTGNKEFQELLIDLLKINYYIDFHASNDQVYKVDGEKRKEGLFSKYLGKLPLIGYFFNVRTDSEIAKQEKEYGFFRKIAINFFPVIGDLFHKPILQTRSNKHKNSNFGKTITLFNCDTLLAHNTEYQRIRDLKFKTYDQAALQADILWREDVINRKMEKVKNFILKYKKIFISAAVFTILLIMSYTFAIGMLESYGIHLFFVDSIFSGAARAAGSLSILLIFVDTALDIPHIALFLILGTAVGLADKLISQGLYKIGFISEKLANKGIYGTYIPKLGSLLDKIIFFIPRQIIKFLDYIADKGFIGAIKEMFKDFKSVFEAKVKSPKSRQEISDKIENMVRASFSFKDKSVKGEIKQLLKKSKSSKASIDDIFKISRLENTKYNIQQLKEDIIALKHRINNLDLAQFKTNNQQIAYINSFVQNDGNRLLNIYFATAKRELVNNPNIYDKRIDLIDNALKIINNKESFRDINIDSQYASYTNTSMARMIYMLTLYKSSLSQLQTEGTYLSNRAIMDFDSLFFANEILALRDMLIAYNTVNDDRHEKLVNDFIDMFIEHNTYIFTETNIRDDYKTIIKDYKIKHNIMNLFVRIKDIFEGSLELIDTKLLPKLLVIGGLLLLIPYTRGIFGFFDRLTHKIFHFLRIPHDIFHSNHLHNGATFLFTGIYQAFDHIVHLSSAFKMSLGHSHGDGHSHDELHGWDTLVGIVNNIIFKIVSLYRFIGLDRLVNAIKSCFSSKDKQEELNFIPISDDVKVEAYYQEFIGKPELENQNWVKAKGRGSIITNINQGPSASTPEPNNSPQSKRSSSESNLSVSVDVHMKDDGQKTINIDKNKTTPTGDKYWTGVGSPTSLGVDGQYPASMQVS